MLDERRATDQVFLDMIKGLKQDLDIHAEQETLLIDQLQRTVEAFSSGASPEVQRKRNEYLDFLIEREKTRAEFRRAVIEKTTASLIWSLLVGLGYSVLHYLFPGRW
jgi:hypothetical protein